MKEILIHTEYIKLGQFLKLANLIQTGGEEKLFLLSNQIYVNNEKENRRGRKLYPEDQIEILGEIYILKC